MGSARGILSFVAGLGEGYMGQSEKNAEQARQAAADKRAQESHDVLMADAKQRQADRQAMIAAGKPVDYMQDPGDADQAQAGLTPKVVTSDNRSFDTTDAAAAYAASQNTPEGMTARGVAALNSIGAPDRAQALSTAATQGKAAQFTLSKDQEKWANDQFDKKLATVTTPEQLATILTGTPFAQGKEVTVSKTPDGKTFQMMVPDDNGNMVNLGQPVSTDPKELQKVLTTYSKGMSMPERLTALHQISQLEESANQHLETVRHNKASEAAQQQQLGVAAGHLAVAKSELQLRQDKQESDLKNDPTRSLTGAEKIMVGGQTKQIDAIDAAINKAQLEPGFDPNAPGVTSMLARKANLERDRGDILKKYLGDTTTKKPYPFGAPAAAEPKTATGKAVAAAPPGSWNPNPAPQSAAAGGIPAQSPPLVYTEPTNDPNWPGGSIPYLNIPTAPPGRGVTPEEYQRNFGRPMPQ